MGSLTTEIGDSNLIGMTLGNAIREQRRRRGVTLRSVAADVGISVSLLSLIERDEQRPTDETLEVLARALEVDALDLFVLADRLPPATQQSITQRAKTDPYFLRELKSWQ